MKKIFEFREFRFGRFTIYLFQKGRYDIGFGLDINGWHLLFLNLIFISFELDISKTYKYDMETNVSNDYNLRDEDYIFREPK